MKHGFIKIAAATPRIKVGDPEYNADRIIDLSRRAQAAGVRILALPELCLTGATCGDLFRSSDFLVRTRRCVERIVRSLPEGIVVIFGAPVRSGGSVFNAAIISRGPAGGNGAEIAACVVKNDPGNRWFSHAGGTMPGERQKEAFFAERSVPLLGGPAEFSFGFGSDFSFAVEIGDDLFSVKSGAASCAARGATLVVNLSAIPAYSGMNPGILESAVSKSLMLKCAYLVASAGEGESTTDYVYTAQNVIAENGEILACANMDEDALLVSEIDAEMIAYRRASDPAFRRSSDGESGGVAEISISGISSGETALTRRFSKNPFLPEDERRRSVECEKILTLQALALKKRIEHTGVRRVVLGLSGGLDSTLALLVAARAFDMLARDRSGILCITMPCFGTSGTTRGNAVSLAGELGCELREINISDSVNRHFQDIGHDESVHNAAYENSQARERTQILMDVANDEGGFVVGTGDLSELALGWATYNGDHMSNYSVNASVPKTVIRSVVREYAKKTEDAALSETLFSILDTPVSPELLPGAQNTEEILGSYELHDFFIYHFVMNGAGPSKLYRIARRTFSGEFSDAEILSALNVFFRRFISQQFKRNCMPDGPKVTEVSLSPRGGWVMPSDASPALFIAELEQLAVEAAEAGN